MGERKNKMFKYTVTFQDSYRRERVIGYVEGGNKEEAHSAAMRIILKVCDDSSFKVYYTRRTVMTVRGIPNTEWIDVGSWSEFFHIYPTDQETVEKAIHDAYLEDEFI